ncbi:MAG: protein-ADP-ribose hydrolase [Longibaculum sp.]
MTQLERLDFLINALLDEYPKSYHIDIPNLYLEKKRLLRSLMNVRPPYPISDTFLKIQDDYLQEELHHKKIVTIHDMTLIRKHIYLYQGDITQLQVDAIVNAANCQMLGCFIPCHGCIDNAIHSFAGIQLRLKCHQIMEKRGCHLQTGEAIITPAYNLASQYIIHTVGPIIEHSVTMEDCQLLRQCYQECLQLAMQYHLQTVAFCCLSTGEFHFPPRLAARIAVEEIDKFLKNHQIDIIFNVFKDQDLQIYQQLLGEKDEQ